MTVQSMTGFATRSGAAAGLAWVWEARSVNGRGLDVRLRLPDGFEALDPVLRRKAAARLARGSVSVALRTSRSAEDVRLTLNGAALEQAIRIAAETERAAADQGLGLAPARVSDLLAVRGVLTQAAAEPGDDAGLLDAVAADIDALLEALGAARAEEGAALARLIGDQIDRVAALLVAAKAGAAARAARTGDTLRARVATVLEATTGTEADPARLAQELALIAVKADITEELDRLGGHVAAARGLVAGPGPVGRKLDFLVQEFNREANTLCSKSGDAELTAIGLDMKHVIDQMREQVQNLE